MSIPCPRCLTKIGLKRMRTHGIKHVIRYFECRYCHLQFSTKETYVRDTALEAQCTPEQLVRMFGKPKRKFRTTDRPRSWEVKD